MDNRQAKNFLRIIKSAANEHHPEFSKKLVQFFEAYVKKPRKNITRKRALHDPNVMRAIAENEGFTPAMKETALRAAVAAIWDEVDWSFVGQSTNRNAALKELERVFRKFNELNRSASSTSKNRSATSKNRSGASKPSSPTRKNKRSSTH